MPILWDEKYSSGVKEIDDQHKKLFEFVNKLEDFSKNGVDDETLADTLTFLGSYTKSHFCYEEMCMTKNNCPTAAQNKDAHKQFLDFYTQVKEEFEKNGGSQALLEKIYKTAASWLDGHICKIDSHLKNCKNVKGLSK